MAWYRPAQQPAIDAGCRRGKFCFFPRELTAIVVKFMNPKQRAAEAALRVVGGIADKKEKPTREEKPKRRRRRD